LFGFDPVSVLVGAAIKILGKAATSAAERWWSARQNRLAFERAITKALNGFSQQHPDLAAAFFDETFLKQGAAPLLAQFFTTRGQLPQGKRLLDAWEQRYGLDGQKWPQLEAAVDDFVQLLAYELSAEDLLQTLLNERAWDATAENTRDALRELQELKREMRGRQTDESLVLIRRAARSYLTAGVTFAATGGDVRDLTANARDTYREAVGRLKRLEYANLDQLRGAFDTLVADRFALFIEAVSAGTHSSIEEDVLREGVEEFVELSLDFPV
jgi:hypothetical protein